MNRTLYISDLDGTLLDKNAEVPEYTIQLLNGFIKAGGHFSYATARTAATALIITEKININVPVILMNGVCIFDTVKNKYVMTEKIPEKSLCEMLAVLKPFKLSGFLFSINGANIDTYYENVTSENAIKFVEEREKKFGKVFIKTDDFLNCIDKNIVYYSVTDRYEMLEPVRSALSKIDGLHINFYRDVYDEGYWYLEISSALASKYNAAEYIRKNYNFDRLIGFGDNLNDLPLFKACDEAYAVENAKDDVKKAANGVIPSNLESGVARKICGLL